MLSNPVVRSSVPLPRVALSPVDGLTVSVTIPLKPLTLLAAMIVGCGQRGIDDGGVRLQFTVTGVVGEIVKSLKLNVAVAVRDRVPSVPVIVSANVPAVAELQDRVEVCGDGGSVKLDAVNEQVGPAGDDDEVSNTVPVNPLTPVTVMVEVVAVLPSAGAAPGADAVIVKSTKWNMMELVEWLSVPLTPVTVTV